MKPKGLVVVWLLFFLAVFGLGFLTTHIVVTRVMADFKEPGVTIGARVKWVQVEQIPYTTLEPLQPTEQIQETTVPQNTLVDMRCQFVDQINPDGSCDNSDPACPETIKENNGRC